MESLKKSRDKRCFYKVIHNEKFGRYMVATVDLAPGDLIFEEDALILGPASYETNFDFCYGCMRLIFDNKNRYVCLKCNVAPLCDRICEISGRCHSTEECNLFKKNKDLYGKNLNKLSGILLHLRLFLSMNKTKIDLEAHLDERKNTKVWQESEETIVKTFQKFGLCDNDSTSIMKIQRLCGIIDVNTFELRIPGETKITTNKRLRGLFVEASMMSHHCRGVAYISVDDNFRMCVRAAVAIGIGDAVSFNYTSPFMGTFERRQNLLEEKYFVCKCEACEDPFETDSHLSSIICPRCRKNYVVVLKKNLTRPYDKISKWQCTGCKKSYGGCLMKSTIEIGKNLIEEICDDDLKTMNDLLKKLELTFHTNHFVVLILKNKILDFCRRHVVKNPLKPKSEILSKMSELSGQILLLLNIVEPGLSRLKGMIMYEIHLPIVMLANNDYSAGRIKLEDLFARLTEARDYLDRSRSILILEPKFTPEGQLAIDLVTKIKLLDLSIEDVRALVASTSLTYSHYHQQQQQDEKNKTTRKQRRKKKK